MSADSRVSFSGLGRRLRAPSVTSLMATALENPHLLSLAAGFTDTATLPTAAVATAVAALCARSGVPEYLQYGTNQGRPKLREILARRTEQLDGSAAGSISPELTVIGNGSQQLLCLAAQVLCDPGDIVLVEQPSYFVFLEILAGLGVRAVPMPAREDGSFDFEGIAALLSQIRDRGESARIKALYLVSYFANPSGYSRSAEEKIRLADIMQAAGLSVPVIEDAAYRDLWFERPWPAASVLGLEAWREFPAMYFGTLTKPFASGLKVGYAHANNRSWFDRVCWLKGQQDFGTTNFNQAILEEVVASGAFESHLDRARPSYDAKMRLLHEALERAGLRALGWRWRAPAGGLCMWLHAPTGLCTDAGSRMWEAAMEEGVLYVPGGLCVADGGEEGFVRLSFGVLNGDALVEAAQRFARAARRAAS